MLAPFMMVFAFGPVVIGYLRAGVESYSPICVLLMIVIIPTVIGAFFLGPEDPEVPKTSSQSWTFPEVESPEAKS